jgi:hypothetical protein
MDQVKNEIPEKIFLYYENMERIFAIKKNSKNYSYEIKKDDMASVLEVFDRLKIPCIDKIETDKCKDETGEPEANYRVVVKVGEIELNILNYNDLLMNKNCAELIKKNFISCGLEARLEYYGKFINFEHKKSKSKVKKSVKVKEDLNKKVVEIKPEVKQEPVKSKEKSNLETSKNGQLMFGVISEKMKMNSYRRYG